MAQIERLKEIETITKQIRKGITALSNTDGSNNNSEISSKTHNSPFRSPPQDFQPDPEPLSKKQLGESLEKAIALNQKILIHQRETFEIDGGPYFYSHFAYDVIAGDSLGLSSLVFWAFIVGFIAFTTTFLAHENGMEGAMRNAGVGFISVLILPILFPLLRGGFLAAADVAKVSARKIRIARLNQAIMEAIPLEDLDKDLEFGAQMETRLSSLARKIAELPTQEFQRLEQEVAKALDDKTETLNQNLPVVLVSALKDELGQGIQNPAGMKKEFLSLAEKLGEVEEDANVEMTGPRVEVATCDALASGQEPPPNHEPDAARAENVNQLQKKRSGEASH